MTTEQAREAWEALAEHCLRVPGDRPLRPREGPGDDAGLAALWPLTQVLAAAVDLAALDRDYGAVSELLDVVGLYRHGEGYAPFPGGGTRYYDDNAWLALACLQLHHQTGRPEPLELAGRGFRFVARGAAAQGGVRWSEDATSRHTCATAPAVEVAWRLHLLAGSAVVADFARLHLGWLDATLLGADGLYADNVAADGTVEPTVWTYNQGTALGAHALAHRATGEARHLDAARAVADATLEAFAVDDRWWTHPPVFNAVFFRNLLALQASAPGPHDLEVLDAYLARLWEQGRDDRGLLCAGGVGSYDGRLTIDQAALVQLLALRAWPSRHWADIA